MQNCNIHGATLCGFLVLSSVLRTSPAVLSAVNDTSGHLLFLDLSSAHLQLQKQLSVYHVFSEVLTKCRIVGHFAALVQDSCHSPGPKVPLTWRGGEVKGLALSQDTGVSKQAKASLLLHREGTKPQDGQNLSQGCCSANGWWGRSYWPWGLRWVLVSECVGGWVLEGATGAGQGQSGLTVTPFHMLHHS